MIYANHTTAQYQGMGKYRHNCAQPKKYIQQKP